MSEEFCGVDGCAMSQEQHDFKDKILKLSDDATELYIKDIISKGEQGQRLKVYIRSAFAQGYLEGYIKAEDENKD